MSPWTPTGAQQAARHYNTNEMNNQFAQKSVPRWLLVIALAVVAYYLLTAFVFPLVGFVAKAVVVVVLVALALRVASKKKVQ